MTTDGQIDLDAIEARIDRAANGITGTLDLGLSTARKLVALLRQAQQPAGGLDGVMAALKAADVQWIVKGDYADGWSAMVHPFEEYWHQAVAGDDPADALTAAARAAGIPIPDQDGVKSATLEIAWLRRMLQWARVRLSKDVYRQTLDRMLADGPTAAPSGEPALVQSADQDGVTVTLRLTERQLTRLRTDIISDLGARESFGHPDDPGDLRAEIEDGRAILSQIDTRTGGRS